MSGMEQQPKPTWLDRDLYPFESHYMDLEPGSLHYIDEGTGRPILFVHGNPTWSFLYRHLITGLSNQYRCLAPDLFGFGLSEKPIGWPYRPTDHARIITSFVETLELDEITVVGQDWGGPIGLDYGTRNSNNVHSIVLMNTWMWPTTEVKGRLFSGLLGSRVGHFLIRRYNFYATRMMKVLVADPSSLTPTIHRHYTAPLATPDDREASWVFPREVTGSNEWAADLWRRRDRIDEKPMLLAWGLKDPALGPLLRRWQTTFPHAQTVEFPESGHFVPEEVGTDLVSPVEEFLDSV